MPSSAAERGPAKVHQRRGSRLAAVTVPVFVDSGVRGHGVGVALMNNVCSLLEDLNLKRVVLATGDAHALYKKFGFEPLAQPEKWMARTAPIPAT